MPRPLKQLRDKIAAMPHAEMSADELVARLLSISEDEVVAILDSCGLGTTGSQLLIAGVRPREIVEIRCEGVEKILQVLDEKLTGPHPCIFTLSYDLGRKLLGINSLRSSDEPDIYLAEFESLVVHDYASGRTIGNDDVQPSPSPALEYKLLTSPTPVVSNFKRKDYVRLVETIRNRIRKGDTYQTNLTHQLTTTFTEDLSPQQAFLKLRKDHPAPYSAFITRGDSVVVSASPELFLSVDAKSRITTSPIKGTRPRATSSDEDARLRSELLESKKDRAENIMIVDLLRNDLGRVCEYGSVVVEELCRLDEHPTYFNLVSTVAGQLDPTAKASDLLKAMFPCGSITGAPKFSTMKIIEELETVPRGLSMGAIGCYIPEGFGIAARLEMSVAIRTMVIRDGTGTFNVGGGITIDSDPENEWRETLTKAIALMKAIGGEFRG